MAKNENPNSKKNQKTILNLIYLGITLIFLVAVVFFYDTFQKPQVEIKPYSELISDIRQNEVSTIELSENKTQFNVETYKNNDNKDRNEVEKRKYENLTPNSNISVLDNLKNSLGNDQLKIGTAEGEIIYSEEPTPWWQEAINNPLVTVIFWGLILGGIGLLFVRKIGDVNSKSISFGNSRAKEFEKDDSVDKIDFTKVAGNEEAKAELMEVIDFLRRPEEFLKMGARIPRGALLVGAPGNGKTLMAKAVAGEAEVPFFYVSGSEFVEMFVGVGAGRVRDLFKKAKKKAPCVIFIDEIDAVGRKRGSGMGNGNDEREQTLNQILTEMDGFEDSSSVIVIGATNRPDVLDPALLRPGRFDRQITVTHPDKKEREKILQVHIKNKKIAKNIDLGIVAQRTSGFSGADLMNVLNEAAILAVREHKKNITNDDLREAIEKVMLGPSLKSKVVTETQKKLTAYHEAGHALVATVLPKANKVQKVTIIPRGRAAGYTFSDSGENDPMTRKQSEFMAEIAVLFGGYVVEKQLFGEPSTGASNDLAKATEMARNMVIKYGMSSLGPISFDSNSGVSYLGGDAIEAKNYSEGTAKIIDEEVKKILEKGYQNTDRIIKKYKSSLDLLAEKLIKDETLEYEDFAEMTKDIKNVEEFKD